MQKYLIWKKKKNYFVLCPQRDSNPGPQGYQGPLNDLQKISLFSILWATYWYYRAQFGLKMSALTCSIEIWSKTIKKLRQIYQFCKLNQILGMYVLDVQPILPTSTQCLSPNLFSVLTLIKFPSIWALIEPPITTHKGSKVKNTMFLLSNSTQNRALWGQFKLHFRYLKSIRDMFEGD